MSSNTYNILLLSIAVLFTALFCVIVVPPLWQNPDVIGALAAGFVNPYASGYSLDTICCWLVLAVLVVFDARHHGIEGGWLYLIMGLVPGVATGFALYLYSRHKQLEAKLS